MPKLIDLTGQIFTDWEAIQREPSRSGKTQWLCKCIHCGKTKVIAGCHLKNNTCRQCCSFFQKNNKGVQSDKIFICEICGKEFHLLNNLVTTRKYCYECSPYEDKNLSHAYVVTVRRRAIKKMLVDYKGGKCQKCGYDKSLRALEFHHLDPEEKDFGISKYLTRSVDSLKAEVDKCNLLCANCHAEEHERLSVEELEI